MPLATLSANENNQCVIYIQLLLSSDSGLNNTAVFGSMWLSNFVAYYTYDYSGAENEDMVTLFVSDYAMTGSKITLDPPLFTGNTAFLAGSS